MTYRVLTMGFHFGLFCIHIGMDSPPKDKGALDPAAASDLSPIHHLNWLGPVVAACIRVAARENPWVDPSAALIPLVVFPRITLTPLEPVV